MAVKQEVDVFATDEMIVAQARGFELPPDPHDAVQSLKIGDKYIDPQTVAIHFPDAHTAVITPLPPHGCFTDYLS